MSAADRRHVHVPVMPREVLHTMQLAPGMTVLDGTLGAGGHSLQILKSIGRDGCLIGIDRDPMMLEIATRRIRSEFSNYDSVSLRLGNYASTEVILRELQIPAVDRVLLDLGLSSDQLADRERGFGFDAGGPLDMRFNPAEGQSAAELLATWSEDEIAACFGEFGEDPAAARIAAEIVRRRREGHPVRTARELEDCVRAATGSVGRGSSRSDGPSTGRNPATRVFQALRIACNEELQHVDRMVNSVLDRIVKPGGIAVILTFHSLEDRIIKTAFKGLQGWQVLTKTPLEATPAEIRLNPRSRSAKLRAARKL